jgi:hypothetical protein
MLTICTAPFARHAAIRYHIRPGLSGDRIAALSAAALFNQAGWFDCGRMQARVRCDERDAPVSDAEPDVDA